MPKRKSLADELADLFNPAPTKEHDPEADVFGAGPALEESDDELAAEPTGRRRIRGDIVMEGKEYSGRRSSRAALFGGEEEGSSGGDEGEEDGTDDDEDGADASRREEEEEEEGEEGREAGSSSEEEEEEEGEDGWLNGGAASGGSSSDGDEPEQEAAGSGGAARRRAAAAAASDDDDASGDGGEGRAAAAAAGQDEMAALEREYEEMQQDEQAAMAGLRERAAKERKKALAVQAQKALWQRGLEARILLQRALAGANRLPQGRMQAAAVATDSEIAAAFGGLAADASALVVELLSLLGRLTERNPAVAEAAAGAAANGAAPQPPAALSGANGGGEEGAGHAATLWSSLDEAYRGFAPFRDAALDRWHRKTALTTGGASLRSGQLRALNQSVSTQVAMLMQDPGKVLKRTRLPRSAQAAPQRRVLCPDPVAPVAKRQRMDDNAEEPAVNGVDPSTIEEERDPETFDDTEFYQTLLREFLEGSADAGGANWHSGPKQRKVVDRRASKGRKLRYHIHEKLVNFMAPVELEAPQYAGQLFSNLFGGGR